MKTTEQILIYVFDENQIHTDVFKSTLVEAGSIQLTICKPAAAGYLAEGSPNLVMVNADQGEKCVHLMLLNILRQFPDVPVICYSASGWINPVILRHHPGRLIGLSYDEVVSCLKDFLSSDLSVIPSSGKSLATVDIVESPQSEMDRLSSVETDILCLIGKGYGSPEMADILDRSKHTVSTHIKNMGKKLQVSGVSELRQVAFRYTREGVCRTFSHSDDHICSCLNERVGTCPILNS